MAKARGTTNRNVRGSSTARRRRREWLLAEFGDGHEAPCYRCGTPLTLTTVTVDRITPGCRGGRYVRGNIRPACARCNCETGGRERRAAIPSQPVDPDTAQLLAAVAGDPRYREARGRIVAAITAVAREHDGAVDPNLVRERLGGASGLTVPPRLVGATYSALACKGRLEKTGWTTSTDTAGGNAGKPCRMYRLVSA